MSKNFEAFLQLDEKGLENTYVIIINGKVVARGLDIEKMLPHIKKNTLLNPLLSPRFLMR